MKEMKCRPILVVGLPRSGTKWLAATIAQHTNVAAPPCSRGGVHESNIRQLSVMFSELSFLDQYIALSELFVLSDMFKDMDLPESFPYELSPRPLNYAQLLRASLSAYAEKQGCSHWVQKFSPSDYHLLRNDFPDAYIITIERSVKDSIRSVKAAAVRRNRSFSAFRSAIFYGVQLKMLTRFKKLTGYVGGFRYETLRENRGKDILCMQEVMGLQPEQPIVKKTENQGHSSFRSEQERAKMFSVSDQIFICLGVFVSKLLPIWLYMSLYPLGKTYLRLVGGTFVYKAEALGFEHTESKMH